MSTSYQKSENALKKSEQLLKLGQQVDALNVLYTTICHRKFKLHGWDLNAEMIMMQYVRLCIDLEKIKYVREGLYYYRAITQQHNLLSLVKIMRELRDLAEKKLENVVAKASDEASLASGVEDLEENETPDSLMLSTLQVEAKDKSAKELHNALLCCWETYKIIMDFSRFVPKIDSMYHDTARKALLFCRDHKRYTEFKRLCDTIRLHYNNFHRYRDRSDFEPFLNAENHLATKLVQMNVAAELLLWSQCFQTSEDVVSLGLHDLVQRALTNKDSFDSKARAILLSETSVFYEKLAQIFQVSDQPLFHASAVLRNLFHTRQHKKNVTMELQNRFSNLATLAFLCIPILHKSMQTTAELEFQKKLSTMVGHSVTPTRCSMQPIIENRGILNLASPEVQELYYLIEKDVNCMKFCFEAERLINEIEKKEEYSCYIPSLKKIVFHKLVVTLANIYTSISIDFFVNSICNESFIPWIEIETIIVQLVHQGFFQIRLDYTKRLIFFGDAAANAGSLLQSRLLRIEKVLSHINLNLPPEYVAKNELQNKRYNFYKDLESKIEVESQRLKSRNNYLAERRLQQEQEQQAREEARLTEEKERQRKEEIDEQSRREASIKYHETLRRREEIQELRLNFSQQIVNEFKAIAEKAVGKIIIKGKAIEDVTVEEILRNEFKYEDYERAQQELRDREKQEKNRQQRLESKKVEHITRALKEAELPLIGEWKEKTEMDDKKLKEILMKEWKEEQIKQVEYLKEQKKIFSTFINNKNDWVDKNTKIKEDIWLKHSAKRQEDLINNIKKIKIANAQIKYNQAQEALRREKAAKSKDVEKVNKDEDSRLWRRIEDVPKRRVHETAEITRDKKVDVTFNVPQTPSQPEPDWSSLRSRPDATPKTEFVKSTNQDAFNQNKLLKNSVISRFKVKASTDTETETETSWRQQSNIATSNPIVKNSSVTGSSSHENISNIASVSQMSSRSIPLNASDWNSLQEKRMNSLHKSDNSRTRPQVSSSNRHFERSTNYVNESQIEQPPNRSFKNPFPAYSNQPSSSPDDGFTTVTKKQKLKSGKSS